MFVHFDLNRPVHLARRDAFFERAVEMLGRPLDGLDAATRLRRVQAIRASLEKARNHAAFAERSPRSIRHEQEFLRFLGLMLVNVDSAQAMIEHEGHLKRDESFLCHFLGVTQEQSALPALHYQRRSEDIHQGLWHLLRLAQGPYAALRRTNLEDMEREERDRYHRAYTSFRIEATG
jgi:hypothetical protein